MIDLKQFFSSKFNKHEFIRFITDRFYGFASNLKDDEYLGKVKLDDKSEIGFFVFEINDAINIENNRVYLSTLASKEMDGKFLDGAISVFYNSKDIWRLTFTRFSYTDNHKKETLNQKRFTYILGIQAINTPLTQFTKEKNYKYQTIIEIQNDFSVEKVSKEFFEEYRRLFEKVNENLKPQKLFDNEEALHAFSKKLLGRIVFLYFLQKKGWLGVEKNALWGDGDKSFLSNLYKKNNKDFYTKQLCNLFFETLNQKRVDDYAPHFECKIPFLNGGLFDKNQKHDENVFIDDALFGEIFETFDRYNFTILEDSPDESEIAIDPEMLGRVFENLLEENYRKGKGAFYTPREIVSYMCKSSIEHYLQEATKEHQYTFGVDEFLELTKMSDEKIADFYLKHPQKYIFVNNYFQEIKPYKNLIVSFMILAKLRGFVKEDRKLTKSTIYKGHQEISPDIWHKILKKEYRYHSHIIGSNKQIRINNKLFIYPTLIKYIQIEERFFALAFLPNIFGDLELSTIFPIREKGIKSKTKSQDAIFEMWSADDFSFDTKVLEELKSLWRDEHSPHTDPHQSGGHNTAVRFSMISHKLFKSENIVNSDLRRHLSLKWYDLKVNKILNNSSITQNDLIDIMLKKIKQIKVLDPAIGSGAFPMGMLHEIVQTRLHLGDKTPYAKLKREIIENAIFGVDIDSDAVEIAKLRFWLSLTVDETVPSPLPNLDFKIMQGNSLIETINGFDIIPKDIYEVQERQMTSLFDMETPSLFDAKIFDKLTAKIHEFYNDSTGAKKQSDKEEIKHLIKEIIEKYLESQEKEYEANEKNLHLFNSSKKQLANSMSHTMENIAQAKKVLNELLQNNFQTKELFLYKLFFGEVLKNGGFDVVIGNPPYVGEKGNKETFAPLKQLKYYQGKMDLFYLFFHVGLDNLKDGGILSLITTNYYITATGAVKLRNDLQERSTILNLINFNELKIFESALGQHNLITTIQKGKFDKLAHTSIVNAKGYLGTKVLQSIVEGKNKDTNYYQIPQEKLFNGGNIQLTMDGIDEVLNKIALSSEALSIVCDINSGADITLSEITKKHLENFTGNFVFGDECFVVNNLKLDSLNLSDYEKNFIKPFIKSSDITKFTVSISNKSLIYLSWEDKIDDKPNIQKHLLKFKVILDDQIDRFGENYPWFALHRPRKQEIFENEKIIVPYRAKNSIFGYSIEPVYASRDVFFITKPKDGYSLKFILAILNSKLIYKWLYYRGKRKGEMLELYQEPLSKIPIRKDVSPSQQQLFITIVDEIINLKKQDPKADTSELEKEIDQLVYQLYGLSDDEIKIIEGDN